MDRSTMDTNFTGKRNKRGDWQPAKPIAPMPRC